MTNRADVRWSAQPSVADPGILLAAALIGMRRPHPTDAAFDRRTAKRHAATKRAKQARKKQRSKK